MHPPTNGSVHLLALLFLLITVPGLAEDAGVDQQAASSADLQVGDPAPQFEELAETGKLWKSSDHVGQKTLVVYFYPADFTSGCLKQAEQFRDNMHKLIEQGVEVVGVSGDSIETHRLFKDQQQLNFTLLADQDGSVAKEFGVPVGKGGRVIRRGADRKPLLDENGERIVLHRDVTLGRWTFVIDLDGRIIYKNTRVNPARDSEEILKFLSEPAGAKAAVAAAENQEP